VIPAYNSEDTILKTLEGFSHQTKLPEEIIVVDNNSEDKTSERVKSFAENFPSLKVIIAKENKKGPSSARNKGVDLSCGDAIAFIDADEIPQKGWVEVIEKELEEGADAITGPVKEYDTDTFLKKYLDIMQTTSIGRRDVIKGNVSSDRFLSAGNMAIKKDLFLQIGKFDEEMIIGEDLDLSKRIYASGKCIFYNPQIAVLHNHRETFKGRFEKNFGSGLLQSRFVKKYFSRSFNIAFTNSRILTFKFPLKIRIQFFSIINTLILSWIVSFFNKYLATSLIFVLLLTITLKSGNIIAKSGKRPNIVTCTGFVLYWAFERSMLDLGRLCGAIKYRVLSI